MAAITWRNVDAPDFRTSLAGLQTAGNMINSAFDSARRGLEDFRKIDDGRVNNAFQLELLKYADDEAMQAAFAADPTLGFDPRKLSQASLTAAGSRVSDLLANTGKRIQNDTGEFNLTEAQGKRDRFTAASSDASKALVAWNAGNENKANEIIANSAALQSLRPGELAELMTTGQNLTTGDVGLDTSRLNNGITAENQSWKREDRILATAAADLANQALASTDGDPQIALATLERLGAGKDPRVMAAARDMVTGQVGNLFQPSGAAGGSTAAGGSGAGGMTTDPMALLRGFEGFRENSYWDVNADRVGYGSDTVTLADGTVRKTRKGEKITREDAERDLNRRVNNLQTNLNKKLGGGWQSLPEGARSAITSVAYNYGEDHKRLAPLYEAARQGDAAAVSRIIRSFGNDNNGVNRDRRNREADIALMGNASNPATRAIETAAANNQTLGDATLVGDWAKDLGGKPAPKVVAQALIDGGQFKGVPVGWLTRHIEKTVNRSRVNGAPTLTEKEAAQILLDNYTQEASGSINRFFTELFDPESTSNIGTEGMRLNDQGVTAAIESAKKGGNTDRITTATNRSATNESLNAAQAEVSALQARVVDLQMKAVSRPSLQPALNDARARLAAAEERYRMLQGSADRNGAVRPVRETEDPQAWRTGPKITGTTKKLSFF